MEKPAELAAAEILDGLANRYGVPPLRPVGRGTTAIEDQPVRLLRLHAILEAGKRSEG